MLEHRRWLTREVAIGDLPMGGHHPIRIQSMTTVDTMDTAGSVAQILRMVEAGCEYVRLTAPSMKEAENLAQIKAALRRHGCRVPLVADIHFTPNAAEVAARIVEKVRINPGNYADKKKFAQIDYTDSEYQGELDRIYKKFAPLVKICKEYGTAVRIGTNHGSLSDRIMSRYGDTPEGMVESAMEFIRICEALDYRQLVISMKSSNPLVMVQAYRLLVKKMIAEQMNYPLHLGVTEAGDGEDGRIKSAVGIGTLLEDGIGDTIRVSLTEEPEFEAPVAQALVNRYARRPNVFFTETPQFSAHETSALSTGYQSKEVNNFVGGTMVPRVVVDMSKANLKDPAILSPVGYRYDPLLDKFHMGDQSVDFVYLGSNLPSFSMPGNLKQWYDFEAWTQLQGDKSNAHPVFTLEEYNRACLSSRDNLLDPQMNVVRLGLDAVESSAFENLQLDHRMVFILELEDRFGGLSAYRRVFELFKELGLEVPVILRKHYYPEAFGGPLGDLRSPEEPLSKLQLYAGTDFGGLLIDGFGDGLWIDSPATAVGSLVSTSFAVLQATRSRISKTEYISCPSCGRTLFDLQETTQLIRNRTNHLKGLKIGIMGCIVNGPGEMADADYGYVGAGPDKITLYRGKEVVKRNVSSAAALDELIAIIQSDGRWTDPTSDLL